MKPYVVLWVDQVIDFLRSSLIKTCTQYPDGCDEVSSLRGWSIRPKFA